MVNESESCVQRLRNPQKWPKWNVSELKITQYVFPRVPPKTS